MGEGALMATKVATDTFLDNLKISKGKTFETRRVFQMRHEVKSSKLDHSKSFRRSWLREPNGGN